jgi:ABC-type transport system involved in multi-copper enzyme maturation permease subunit
VASVAVNMKSRGLAAPLDWLSRLGGPMVTKELRVASRRRRTYLLRFAYLVALTAYAAWAWINEIEWYGTRSAADVLRMAAFAEGVTARILLFQFVALPAIAIVMLSTSITEEIQRRTLGVLMTTPVSAFRIVLGKMLSQVFQLLLLLAISLPLLVLLQVFGGVPREAVAVGLTVTLTTCILAGSLSLLVSTFFRRAYMAVLLVALVLLASWAGHECIAGAIPGFYGAPPMWVSLFLALSPFRWIELIYPDPTLLAAGSAIWFTYHALFHVAAMLVVSALLLAWSARRLRRVGLRLATGELRPAAKWERLMRPGWGRAAAGDIRRITGSPVFWRERQVRFGPSRMATIVAWACICAIFIVLEVFSIMDGTGSPAAQVSVMLWVLAVLVATIQPAAAFAAEREAGTLPLLLATPMGRGRIVLGKALGAIYRSAPFWGLLLAHAGALVLSGRAHPTLLLHVALVLAGSLVFVTGAGLFFSACSKRTVVAMTLNLGLAMLIFAAPPLANELSPSIPNAWAMGGLAGWLHPAWQVHAVTAGAGPFLPFLADWRKAFLEYDWGFIIDARLTLRWGLTTTLVAVASLVWVSGGLILAGLSLWRLRRALI